MITLYVKSNCPYSAKAIAAFKEHNVPYAERNIADPSALEELLALGGKRQVPFVEDDNQTPYLVDDDVHLYESDDIVRYIEQKYGGGGMTPKGSSVDAQKIRLHVENDSDVCEGCQ